MNDIHLTQISCSSIVVKHGRSVWSMLDIGIYGELRFFVYSFYLLFVCCLCDEHTHRWADTKPSLFQTSLCTKLGRGAALVDIHRVIWPSSPWSYHYFWLEGNKLIISLFCQVVFVTSWYQRCFHIEVSPCMYILLLYTTIYYFLLQWLCATTMDYNDKLNSVNES